MEEGTEGFSAWKSHSFDTEPMVNLGNLAVLIGPGKLCIVFLAQLPAAIDDAFVHRVKDLNTDDRVEQGVRVYLVFFVCQSRAAA